jgi:hypothetical protein
MKANHKAKAPPGNGYVVPVFDITKELYEALRAVSTDPKFNQLSSKTRESVEYGISAYE